MIQRTLQAAAAKFREVRHASGVAVTLVHLARLGRESGLLSVEERNEHAREALETAEGMGFTTAAQEAAGELASCLEEAGLLADAESALERGLEWARVSDSMQVEADYRKRLQQVRHRREEHARLTAVRTAEAKGAPSPN